MGALNKILHKIIDSFFPSKSKIVSNEMISPHFRFLTIQGSALKKEDWIAGQKIKIELQNHQTRSYTPTSWDKKNGVMQTLIYDHGKGPGSLWAREVKPSSKVSLKGPRSSLKLEGISEAIFFGDETTFGLAHALKTNIFMKNAQFIFEATDLDESRSVLEKFSLGKSQLFPLYDYPAVAKSIFTLHQEDPLRKIILVGNQISILQIKETLICSGISADSIITKIYWGKKK